MLVGVNVGRRLLNPSDVPKSQPLIKQMLLMKQGADYTSVSKTLDTCKWEMPSNCGEMSAPDRSKYP